MEMACGLKPILQENSNIHIQNADVFELWLAQGPAGTVAGESTSTLQRFCRRLAWSWPGPALAAHDSALTVAAGLDCAMVVSVSSASLSGSELPSEAESELRFVDEEDVMLFMDEPIFWAFSSAIRRSRASLPCFLMCVLRLDF